ncbi:MAG: EpsG family protein [Aquificaceae bacterium]
MGEGLMLEKLINVYTLMFLLPSALVFSRLDYRKVLFILLVLYSVIIGFRHQVGCNWENYQIMLNYVRESEFLDYIFSGDPGYMLLNWISYHLGGGLYLVNLVCGLLFMYGLVSFVRKEANPLLAFVVAVPYLIVVVAMGYTRQSVAIGFVLLALSFYYQKRLLLVVFALTLATLFHKTAIVSFLPLLLLPKDIVSYRNKALVALWSALLFYLLVVPSLDFYLKTYVGVPSLDSLFKEYVKTPQSSGEPMVESSGGPIRIFMNLVPAVIFLALGKRFLVDRHVYWIMLLASVFSFLLLPVVFKFSTLADRLALYLTPLQLFVFNRVVNLFEGEGLKKAVMLGVVLYYFSVLIVWLLFAKHAHCWIPYRSFLWEILNL